MSEKRVVLNSELSFDTVQAENQRLTDILRAEKTSSIFLDLSAVEHCDSAGLALLIEAKSLALRYAKQLTMSDLPASIAALAKFSGVDTLLSIPPKQG
jgi:phospholipid transport system transporter-binding protein